MSNLATHGEVSVNLVLTSFGLPKQWSKASATLGEKFGNFPSCYQTSIKNLLDKLSCRLPIGYSKSALCNFLTDKCMCLWKQGDGVGRISLRSNPIEVIP